MPGNEVLLRFPAHAEHLSLVRLVVGTLAEEQGGIDGPRLDDLRLAVSEACANAIEAYGRQGRPGAPITVRAVVSDGRIELAIRDDAGGFDPRRARSAPPATAPDRLNHERGLGIPLMHALADLAEFRSDGEGTTVRLVITARRHAPRADATG